MNRSGYCESYTGSGEVFTFWGSVQGAGAAPPTIPTTTQSPTSSIQPMTATNNFVSGVAADLTRSGVGLYTVKLKEGLPVILDISMNVWGTDGKWSQITDYNPTTRVLTFKTFAAGGGAADIVSTDNVKLTIIGQMSAGMGF
jgi:hypothetical protein